MRYGWRSSSRKVHDVHKEVKEKWVTALRSGQYPQGRELLRFSNPETNRDEFCCLGVLCELAVQEGVIAHPRTGDVDDDGVWHYGLEPYTGTGSPPPAVRKWSGLTRYAQLVTLNDQDGKTFPEIADWIEANL